MESEVQHMIFQKKGKSTYPNVGYTVKEKTWFSLIVGQIPTGHLTTISV